MTRAAVRATKSWRLAIISWSSSWLTSASRVATSAGE